jgi:hypothetical protein
MAKRQLKVIALLSGVMAIALGIVSYYGAFIPSTYERDAPSMAIQGMGQDIFDLFFVVPLLLISMFFMLKNKQVALFVFSGTIFYILYSFFIYSFGVHFNNLFLLYCLILGASLYTFILVINELNKMNVHKWFNNSVPVGIIGIYFILIAFMFYLLWLKDIISAIVNDTIPKNVSDYKLLVNPVHVLDIAFVLPGLLITAILLIRKQQLGFIFTPIFLIFIILLAMALIAMVIMLKIKGISEDLSIAVIFIILAIISLIIFYVFMKKLNIYRGN